MADKRISQLVERTDIANNDVLPIVASGATTTNKVTISTIQDWMQDNLDVGVTSVGITFGTSGTDINASGSPVTSSGNITINLPTASATNRGALSSADWITFNAKQPAGNYVTLDTVQTITAQKTFTTSGGSDSVIITTTGAGFALDTIKAGNGEVIRVNKTSGTGNAMTVIGGNFEAPTIVKTGGTSSQFLKADGSVDSSTYLTTGSAASTYLPLAGGTLTGALGGTSANFTGSVGIGTNTPEGSGLTVASGGILVSLDPGANRKVLELYATSTGAKVSSSYVGSSSYGSLELLTSGLARLTIADTGAATFSSSLTASNGILTGVGGILSRTGSTSTAVYGLFLNTSGGLYFGAEGSAGGTVITGNPAYFGAISSVSGLGFSANNGNNVHLSLASTGAATFSSSVTATSGLINGTTDAFFDLNRNASGSAGRVRFQTAGTDEFEIGLKGGVAGFHITKGDATELVTVLTGGNVGIGTTSPDVTGFGWKTLTIKGGTNSGEAGVLELQSPSTTGAANLGIIAFLDGSNRNAQIAGQRDGATNSGALSFTTWNAGTGAERMRITSGGEVLVGMTSTTTTGVGSMITAGGAFANLRLFGTGTQTYAQFFISGTAVGSITGTSVLTSYNTTSDYRLKEDLQEMKGLEKVQEIKVYNYKWVGEDSRMDGVLAHELAEVLPYAVHGEKDEVDEEGNDKMQGVDYSKIVPILIKAIQEQQEQIDSLKTK